MDEHDQQHSGEIERRAHFVTTHWSVVLQAGERGSPDAAVALEKLCRAYWPPLYAFVRREGHGPEAAADLTQEFFSRLLQGDSLCFADPGKGRFRSFLLALLKRMLVSEWRHERRQKRGGDAVVFSLDAHEAEDGYQIEPPDPMTPETVFERRWAETALDRVLDRLETEYRKPCGGFRKPPALPGGRQGSSAVCADCRTTRRDRAIAQGDGVSPALPLRRTLPSRGRPDGGSAGRG
jgi:RNA polymerase sigma factor (sigma-70 family)